MTITTPSLNLNLVFNYSGIDIHPLFLSLQHLSTLADGYAESCTSSNQVTRRSERADSEIPGAPSDVGLDAVFPSGLFSCAHASGGIWYFLLSVRDAIFPLLAYVQNPPLFGRCGGR